MAESRSSLSLLCGAVGVTLILVATLLAGANTAIAQGTAGPCDPGTGDMCQAPGCVLTAGGCPPGYTGKCDFLGFATCGKCQCRDIDPEITVECKCRK
jgi:hypothetical protein